MTSDAHARPGARFHSSPAVTLRDASDFVRTLRGLDAGLFVAQIATFGLETCSAATPVAEVLASERLSVYDAIPVTDANRIVGVLDRGNPNPSGTAKDAMVPLWQVRLTGSHTPLRLHLSARGDDAYTLVVDESGPCGIVTRSDYLKLPVRLLGFAFVTYLEIVMQKAIAWKCAGDDEIWRACLDEKRKEKLEKKANSLRGQNLDLPLLELTEFCDKRDIMRRLFDLGRRFSNDLAKVEELRNLIAHASTYVAADSEISKLVEQLRLAEHWIQELDRPGV